MFESMYLALLQRNDHPVIDWVTEEYYGPFIERVDAENWANKQSIDRGKFRFKVEFLENPKAR
jgi:trans-aconitate methyltransferase